MPHEQNCWQKCQNYQFLSSIRTATDSGRCRGGRYGKHPEGVQHLQEGKEQHTRTPRGEGEPTAGVEQNDEQGPPREETGHPVGQGMPKQKPAGGRLGVGLNPPGFVPTFRGQREQGQRRSRDRCDQTTGLQQETEDE